VKTEDLVSALASAVEPVDRKRAARQLVLAWITGLLVSVLFLAGVLRVNATLPLEAMIPMFWVRAAFCASLMCVSILAVKRLGHPGTRLGRVPVGLALPVLAMWGLAAVTLAEAPKEERIPLLLGHTALVCPWLITLLAAPWFVALIWAMRELAPTRLRLAGAGVGLAAGASGALVYTLHCPELASPFLSVWYVLGMLFPAAMGAMLGPRLLRW
jgi:hypothetical protein